MLVVGSRGYGPLRAVLLGSVSSALVRSAQSPLVVVPRAANGDIADARSQSALGRSAGQLPQHEVQDPAVAVVLPLVRRVDSDSRVESTPPRRAWPERLCALLERRQVEGLVARSARATRPTRRPGTAAAGRPSRPGSSGGCARRTPRARSARRAGAAPWRPSRATSPSRTPCPRARTAARPRRRTPSPPRRSS